MAGQPGNYFTAAIGKQTAKGTPQTTPTYKLRSTGGFVRPSRNIVELEETDSSRQARPSVVVGSRVEGALSHYLRSDEYGLMAFGAMGANADSGAGPYTHTATSSGAAPYFTIFEAYGGTTLVNRYSDCRITKQVIAGQVGGIFTVENTWAGLAALFGSTDPVLTPSSVTPLTWPKVTVTKGAVTADVISQVELTIDNGGEFLEGDTGMTPFDYMFGRWTVTGSILMLFETDAEFREFHAGSGAGTVPTETIFAEDLSILISRGTTDEINFTMTQVEYQTFDIQPNTDGSAIKVPMAFRAKAQTVIANTLSVVTKNSVVSY